jgi:hypothetical protein
MAYNLSTAAAATGANKSMILRAIEAGRISAQRDAANQWSIEVDELHRVFPALPGPAITEAERDATTDVLVAELRQTVADLRADRDHWRAAFENQQRLALAQTVEQPRATGSYWWRRAKAGTAKRGHAT